LYEELVKVVEVHGDPRVAISETKKKIERDRKVESACLMALGCSSCWML
jgi:hypothetical protein